MISVNGSMTMRSAGNDSERAFKGGSAASGPSWSSYDLETQYLLGLTDPDNFVTTVGSLQIQSRQMNQLGLISLNHEMTENLSDLACWKGFDLRQLSGILQGASAKVDGLLLLSTCNRVEILYTLQDPSQHIYFYDYLIENLPSAGALKPIHLTGRPVVTHLLRLASGLESMVLGETEIRHQMKDAVRQAVELEVLDGHLFQLLQGVFRESREIRSQIPANLPLSISSLAVRHLEEALGGFASGEGSIVVIGSGPMSRAGAEYIYKWGGRNIVWVNRTLSKIASAAESFKARILTFDEFAANPKLAGSVRAILTATSAPAPVITVDLLKSLGGRPVVVDLALPADTATDAMSLCHHIGLESIKRRLEENRQRREEAAAAASTFVEEAKHRLEAEWIAQVSAPVIKEIQKDVLDRSRERLNLLLNGHLSHLTARDRRILHDWAIRFNRDMNRIHRDGMERVLKYYYNKNGRN